VTAAPEIHEAEAARKLSGAMLEHSGFAAERLPGVATAFEQFMTEAPRALAALFGSETGRGSAEPPQAATGFRAIGDCAGLVAAIFSTAEPPGRLMIVLDERIDDLVVTSVFGAAAGPDEEDTPGRTPIEAALVEAFARALGRALETAFAPFAGFALTFEKLVTLTDSHALGKRDQPVLAARFSLPMSGSACEGLVLIPQTLLQPFRKALEREPADEAPTPDSRWSHRMEAEVKQTRLPVTAVLEDLPMSLGDVAAFRVGEVLTLQSGDFAAVRLECAGRGMFLCKLGQGEGRYRLELDAPIAESAEVMIETAAFDPQQSVIPSRDSA